MRSLKNLGGLVVPGRYRFREPDESRTFATLKETVDFVQQYRQANNIPVDSREALQAEIEDWLCNHIGSPEYYCNEDGAPMPLRDHTGAVHTSHYTGYQGQAKWEELHEWALALVPEVTPDARTAWLETFTSSLPCGECRRSWRALTREDPAPVDGTAEAMWLWSYDLHNRVREKLDQPIIDEPEARKLYTHEELEEQHEPEHTSRRGRRKKA